MITKYYIKKKQNEELLIIHLDYNYEFSKFNKKIIHNITDYIITNKIKFNGNKVILVVGSLILGTLILNPINYEKPLNNEKYTYVSKINLANYNDKNELISTQEIINNKDKIVEEKKETSPKSTTTSTINKKANTKKSSSSSNIINKKKTSNKSTKQNKVANTKKNTTTTSSNTKKETSLTVTVYRNNGTIIKLDLEEYIIGVVGAEMPASFSLEALKAQAIVSRTYALKALQNGKKLTDNESTQAYKSNNELQSMWSSSYNTYYNKIKKAVTSTKGMYITYNNQYIDAVFHSTSNGYTEDASNVWKNSLPYLKSVESPWDKNASTYYKTTTITYNEATNILGFEITKDTPIEILSKTNSNRIKTIKIGTKTYTGVELRNLLKLRSADFDIKLKENIEITTKGYGHGVGMSQYGANGMAKAGFTYTQIIKHYYQGVNINKLK